MNVHSPARVLCRLNLSLIWISFCPLLTGTALAQLTPQNWVQKFGHAALDAGQVNGMLLSKDSTIWVFNGNGIFEIDNYRDSVHKISNLNISNPVSDGQGNLYYFQGDIVYFISEDSIKSLADSLEQPSSFKLGLKHMKKRADTGPIDELVSSSIAISCLGVEPSGGRIWIGTKKSGLFYTRKPRPGKKWNNDWAEHLYKIPSKKDTNSVLLSNSISILYCDKTGGVWVGFENGLMRFDQESPETIIRDMHISCIKEREKEGQIWVTGIKKTPHQNHLAIFIKENDSYSITPELPVSPLWPSTKTDLLRDLFFDDAGDFWLAGELLYRARQYGSIDSLPLIAERIKNKGDLPDLFSGSENFNSLYPSCFVQDREGIIWIGTLDNGLFYVKKTPGINVIEKQMIKCHDDYTGHLLINAVEGSPPFQLLWRSRRTYKQGESKQFPVSLYDLPADTFEFWLTDRLNTDTGYMLYILDNPDLVKAKIAEWIPPTYEGDCDGKITIEASGGRVNLKSGKRKDEYNYKWSNNKAFGEKTNWDLGLGAFEVIVSDTFGCSYTLRDTFRYPQRFSDDAWDCTINLKDKFEVNFIEFDSAQESIKSEYLPVLESISGWMKTFPSIKIEIGGHVHRGCINDAACKRLSLNRALAAQEILVDNFGIPRERIRVIGYGKSKPAPNGKDIRIDISVFACDPLEIKMKCSMQINKKRKPCRN